MIEIITLHQAAEHLGMTYTQAYRAALKHSWLRGKTKHKDGRLNIWRVSAARVQAFKEAAAEARLIE